MTRKGNSINISHVTWENSGLLEIDFEGSQAMKRKIIIIIISFLLSDFLLPITCVGSCFEVTLEKDSMYTPNDSQLHIRLTEEAKIEGNYHVRVTVTIGDTVVLKQTSALEKQQDATYKLEFPSLERKTTAKCYVELLVDEVFLEGKTQPITLWPPYKGFEIKTGSKKIWVYDPSKSLTAIFEKAGVKTLDATFQAVRDFGEPNIVFIGQEIDPNQITAFTYRLSEVRAKAVIIYLKQSQLPKNSRIEIPAADNKANNIICDMNSPFLQGLDEMRGKTGRLR